MVIDRKMEIGKRMVTLSLSRSEILVQASARSSSYHLAGGPADIPEIERVDVTAHEILSGEWPRARR